MIEGMINRRKSEDKKMASSSSNQHVTLEVGEEIPYPYPTNFSSTSFVSMKLRGRDNYSIWESQMICLFKSHDMFGFIDGTILNPQTSVTEKGKVGDQHHRLWARSDALVKGWILGSLSENTITLVLSRLKGKVQQNGDSTAKDVWDELQTIYDHPQIVADVHEKEEEEQLLEMVDKVRSDLYKFTQKGFWSNVNSILQEKKVTATEILTNKGNTALHVAVATLQSPEFLEKMLELAPENTQLIDVINYDRSTLLHVAAIVGNTEAAKVLVARNPELLFADDNQGHTPLAVAISNMHTEMSQFLRVQMKNDNNINSYFYGSRRRGDELPSIVISSKDFSLALDLLKNYEELDNEAELMTLAQNFPSKLNMFDYYIATYLRGGSLQGLVAVVYVFIDCIFGFFAPVVVNIITLFVAGILWILIISPLNLLKILASLCIRKKLEIHEDAMKLLLRICYLMFRTHDLGRPLDSYYYTKPILVATRRNAYEVVFIILKYFPEAIWSVNEDGHNIMQYAVINRSEKVYNLLTQRMSERNMRNIYRTMKDSSGNNLLHLAARLAPSTKLNLTSGAALQIQSELQWFKELEGYVSPLSITQKNSFDETPQMVFTREHKELMIEGENWMKATAESYTITAALITTIVFAAAITVPGGSNQETGIPIFTHHTAFKIFAISDAISLFTSVTSLLMFLSILTARFAEHDFLFKLPTKLLIGLTTLFISTTAMIVAFGATLYLVFGQQNSRILIPIAVLTCLPISAFVTLQFPLVMELMSATYGRSIFRGRYKQIPISYMLTVKYM